jgi:hypothetical protein
MEHGHGRLIRIKAEDVKYILNVIGMYSKDFDYMPL